MQENFNETPTESSSSDAIPSYLQGKDPNTPVMMYCTGGIRCDVYSAHLRDKGFNNLYTLEGGIQNYLREEGHELWDGSLFVFDGRMAVPSGTLPPCGLACKLHWKVHCQLSGVELQANIQGQDLT